MSPRTRVFQTAAVIFFSLVVASTCYAGDTRTVSVSAVVLSKGNCTFRTKTATLAFGNLDPGNPVDVTVNTPVTFRCQASGNNLITFSITDDSGLYETGPNAPRMRNTVQTTQYLPYTLSLSPTSGSVPKVTDQTLTVTGTVKGADYQNALAGNYSDTVIISIDP